MSGFEKLRDESNFFTNELRRTSLTFSVVTGGKIRDGIEKKTQDLKLFSSKLKLLEAKPLSLVPQIVNEQHENALEDYGDTVSWKLIEAMTVNSLTQAHTVKSLITTPDKDLDPEMIQKKKAVIECIFEYHRKELWLSHLNTVLKEKEAECGQLKEQWDKTLGTLKILHDSSRNKDNNDRGPLYGKLKKIVDKLELMRWLISQIVCTRSRNYDWISDPDQRLSVLALTRQHNTVDMFTQDK